MPLVLKDRVKETSTTTGTGTFTLAGASTGFQSFSVIGNGTTTFYTIALQGGNEWEVGVGTYTSSGTTLARNTVIESSNGGTLVNFSAGTKDVFVTQPAERTVYDSTGSTGGTDSINTNTANTVVRRDASGNFSAGTITAALSGNATTATTATNSTNATVTTSSTASAFKVPFANTTASTTGNYGLLQDSEATFTYNPSTNTLVAGVFSGSGASLTALNASNLSSGTVPGDRGVTAGSASSSFVEYNGTTATAGQFYGGTTTPTGTTRLNYSGYFYTTFLNLIGSADTTTAASHYWVETGSDGFVRPKTLANVRTEIVTTASVNAAAATTVGTVTTGVWNAGAVTTPVVNATNGLIVNSNTVSASYSIPSGSSASSVGPITVASGQTVTVPSGSRWVVL